MISLLSIAAIVAIIVFIDWAIHKVVPREDWEQHRDRYRNDGRGF
jgi:hypothetical protein